MRLRKYAGMSIAALLFVGGAVAACEETNDGAYRADGGTGQGGGDGGNVVDPSACGRAGGAAGAELLATSITTTAKADCRIGSYFSRASTHGPATDGGATGGCFGKLMRQTLKCDTSYDDARAANKCPSIAVAHANAGITEADKNAFDQIVRDELRKAGLLPNDVSAAANQLLQTGTFYKAGDLYTPRCNCPTGCNPRPIPEAGPDVVVTDTGTPETSTTDAADDSASDSSTD